MRASSQRRTRAGESGARPPRRVGTLVASSFDDVRLDPEQWDAAVAALGGSVYMTWDWLRTWWRFYGRGRELRLFVCRDGDRIAALFPTYLDDIGVWPLRLRVARLVGANLPPKVFDPPIDTVHAGECFAALVAHLMGPDGCDVVSVGPLSSTWDGCRTLRAENTIVGLRLEADDSDVHAVFQLPDSREAYFKSLSKHEQKNRRYYLNAFRKEHEVEVRLIDGPVEALLAEFETFATLHARQWQAEGKAGHFAAWPEALAYNRELVAILGALGRVRFLRITADGTTVCSRYIYAFGGRWYAELPARLPGPEWDRFRLGPMGAVTMMAEAITAGVSSVQGGLAHYEHKLRLGAEEHPALTLRVYGASLASRVRQHLFGGLRHALRIGYLKIWYRRIMPRLPQRWHRSQSWWWLRFDY